MPDQFGISDVQFKWVRRNPIGSAPGSPQRVGVLQATINCRCGYKWIAAERAGLSHAHGGIFVTCPACKEQQTYSLKTFEDSEPKPPPVNDALNSFAMPGVLEDLAELEAAAAKAISAKFPYDTDIEISVKILFDSLNRTYQAPITVDVIVLAYEKARSQNM